MRSIPVSRDAQAERRMQEQTKRHTLRRGRGTGRSAPHFLPFEPLPFLLSLIVVFGLFLTVDCLTNRPVIALRPRLPPLDLLGMGVSLLVSQGSHATRPI